MTRRPPRSHAWPLEESHGAIRVEPPTRLLPQRAFVVHLREGVASRATDAGLAGRVEHVASGRVAEFESLAELGRFMRRLARQEAFGQAGRHEDT